MFFLLFFLKPSGNLKLLLLASVHIKPSQLSIKQWALLTNEQRAHGNAIVEDGRKSCSSLFKAQSDPTTRSTLWRRVHYCSHKSMLWSASLWLFKACNTQPHPMSFMKTDTKCLTMYWPVDILTFKLLMMPECRLFRRIKPWISTCTCSCVTVSCPFLFHCSVLYNLGHARAFTSLVNVCFSLDWHYYFCCAEFIFHFGKKNVVPVKLLDYRSKYSHFLLGGDL